MDDQIDKILEDLFQRYRNVYDRFTFDHLFRELLRLGYDHEEAKDMILYNCRLSALVLQERLHNQHYLKIRDDQELSDDLQELRDEFFAALCRRGTFN